LNVYLYDPGGKFNLTDRHNKVWIGTGSGVLKELIELCKGPAIFSAHKPGGKSLQEFIHAS
jgi:hypothetical protein